MWVIWNDKSLQLALACMIGTFGFVVLCVMAFSLCGLL